MSKVKFPKNILVIDDDPTVGRQVSNLLNNKGVTVQSVSELDRAFDIVQTGEIDLVMAELNFEAMPGLVIAQNIRVSKNSKSHPGMVISCGHDLTAKDNKLISELGYLEILKKPISNIKVVTAFTGATQQILEFRNKERLRKEIIEDWKKNKQIDNLIELLNKKLANAPIQRYKIACELYVAAGTYDRGIRLLDTILNEKSQSSTFQNMKGRLLFAASEFEKARTCFETADELAPNHIGRLTSLIETYLAVDLPELAVAKIKQLIKLSLDKKLKFEFFKLLDRAGYYQHAINLCQETTSSRDIVIHYNTSGVTLSQSGDHESALKEYELALKFNPDFRGNYHIYFNIALSELKAKRPDSNDKARSALEKCLELAPDHKQGKKLLKMLDSADYEG